MYINKNDFIHSKDKLALDSLEKIPGFSILVKKIMDISLESFYHGINMASKIRLSPKQLPNIYNHLPKICQTLNIIEPELYLEMDPFPNAYTFGDTQTYITITSGLIECMTDEELDAVIAHECGHILCRHSLYHTVVMCIKNGADLLGWLGKLAAPIQYALFYWYRMSEFSADSVSAIITSSEIVSNVMARFSGGPKNITKYINFNEWAKQADEYEKIYNDGMWNKTLQTWAMMDLTHPFSAVRVREIMKWAQTKEYYNIKSSLTASLNMRNMF